MGSRVVQDGIVAHQPAKPAAHWRQPRVLCTERERLPVPLPVVVEISLIAFEDGTRHFHRMLEPTLLGPADEVGNGPARVIGSVLRVVVNQQPFQMLFHEQAECRVWRDFHIALLGDAGHHFTPARRASPLPFGPASLLGILRFHPPPRTPRAPPATPHGYDSFPVPRSTTDRRTFVPDHRSAPADIPSPPAVADAPAVAC